MGCVRQAERGDLREALNRDQLSDALRFHVFTVPTLNNCAARHHQIIVRQFGGKIIKLLNQQNRHITAIGETADHGANFFYHGRLNTFRRLIENK